MEIISSALAPVNFLTSKAVTATLSVMGASCAESERVRRVVNEPRPQPASVTHLADRRRTPSGTDDQHLYTVNL